VSDEAGSGERTLDDLLDATLPPDDPRVPTVLACGDVELHGRMPWSSNGTFLVSVEAEVDGTIQRVQAIYKPERGERPLWDFPPGLWRREVATYRLAEHLGWHVVPPTVVRTDGPLDVGSLQCFVPSEYSEHYFTLRDDPTHRPALEQLCVLDVVSNNTDRKGGHVLLGRDGGIWGIDHGLSFHEEFKLRTVLWDFSGDPLPRSLVEDVVRLIDEGVPASVAELLEPAEVEAVLMRSRALVASGRFPTDPTGRRYPWPLV
jgi:hypothetical protein